MNSAVYKYWAKIDSSRWSRAWFYDYSKYDFLVNNLCEYFNSYILKTRDKLILTMFEMVRKIVMINLWEVNVSITLKGKVCPIILEKFKAIYCLFAYLGDGIFEVKLKPKQFVVDLKSITCGCRKWEMTRIPCLHMIQKKIWYNNLSNA